MADERLDVSITIPLVPIVEDSEGRYAEHVAEEGAPMVTMLALPFDDSYDNGRYVDTFEPTIFDRSLSEISAGDRSVSFRADGTHEGDFRSLVATTSKPLSESGGAKVWKVGRGNGAGIYAQANILTSTQAGKDAWEVITQGIGRHVSVSFNNAKYDLRETPDGRPNYHFYDADWTEVTFVDKPALTQTWLRPTVTKSLSEQAADNADLEQSEQVEEVELSETQKIVGKIKSLTASA